MGGVFSFLKRYPFVLATVLVAIFAGILAVGPAAEVVPWVLGTFALLMAGRSFVGMVRELRSGSFGVDLLAITAISAAVAVGEYWAALVIVLMLTGGEALEDYAAHRAKKDLTALLSKSPQSASRINADGSVSVVPIDELVPGDEVLVRANEVVPVDGTLTSATGEFDESSLTGESLPVELVRGEEVLSGVVNGSGSVTLIATRAAKDSQYQQIAALVEEAATSKAPMVRLADRFAVPFTLISLLIAGLAWWFSGDPVRFAEVLVVATPCPLIIAAPVAFMAGMSRSARGGAIVKSSATLEKFHRARSIAFDKTGTLTYGQPSLTAVRTTLAQFGAGVSENRLLQLAASAEQTSAHTLAAAVTRGAKDRGISLITPEKSEESTANGVISVIDGHDVWVGKRSFIEEKVGKPLTRTELVPGELAIYVAVDRQHAGALVLKDEVRENSGSTLEVLKHHGIEHFTMLTGDDQATAKHVAAELGIDRVQANCLPADKVAAVHGIKERPVIMVGDGVNDAPVLAAADVGVAMGARGATAASESADVVILRDDISRVAHAVVVGRETVNVALQAIAVGILLSLVFMTIAAFGNLPAIVGAWMQEVVDVVAILWALRASRGKEVVPELKASSWKSPAVTSQPKV
ncbi:heavy metal translocating P-type ATPase [Neomicrococcus lactis]